MSGQPAVASTQGLTKKITRTNVTKKLYCKHVSSNILSSPASSIRDNKKDEYPDIVNVSTHRNKPKYVTNPSEQDTKHVYDKE